MKFFNFKTRFSYLFISFLSFSAGTLQGQEAMIDGPYVLCDGECGTYYFHTDSNSTFDTYEWNINGSIITTPSPYMDVCWGGTISVIATDATGVTYGASYDIYMWYVYSISGGIISDACASVSPAPGECLRACPNATVNYSFVSDDIANGWVNVYNMYWSVSGAESWVNNGITGVTVNWGAAGGGNVEVGISYDGGMCLGWFEVAICVEINDKPIAGIESIPAAENDKVTVCQGQEINFVNTSTGATTYEWSFGSTEINPSFTFESPGVYTVALIAYDNCLCSDVTTMTVEVIDAKNPAIDCVSTICEDETITYTSNASCGVFNWNISGNGTLTEGGGVADNFVTVNWGSGPAGFIELLVGDCGAESFCQAPTVVEIPILSNNATITGATKVCKGVIEEYSLPAYEATAYTWSVSTYGTIVEGQGTNEITVQWTDLLYPFQTQVVSVNYDNCYLECGGSASLDVDIVPEYYVTGEIEVCENTSQTYTAINTKTGSSFACNWTISQGGSIISTINAGTSPVIDWNFGAGFYRLTAIPVNIADFCVESYVINVHVIAEPLPVSNIEGDIIICPDNTYAYKAISNTPTNNFSWEINNGGVITTRNGNPVTVVWGDTPPYSLIVVEINTGGLPCESAPVSLSIDAIEDFTIAGHVDVCRDETSSFITENYNGNDCSWSIQPASAGTIIGNLTLSSIEVFWEQEGAVTIEVIACGQTATFEVEVHGLPQPIITPLMALCPNETVQLSTTQVFESYEWRNIFDEIISTDATATVSEGYYEVDVVNAFGCTGKKTIHVQENLVPVASISSPSPNYFCNVTPSADLYAINSTEGYAYQWFYNGTTIGGDSPVIQVSDIGVYNVAVTDVNGCTKLSNPLAIYACTDGGVDGSGWIIDTTGNGNGGGADGLLCLNAGTDFELLGGIMCNERFYGETSILASISGSVDWYFYEEGTVSTATGDTVSHTYSHAGFFKVVMGANYPDGNGGTFSCSKVRVDTVLLAADFEVKEACVGASMYFMDASTFLPYVNITGWEWNFGDPVSGVDSTSVEQNPSHVFANAGTYAVTLIATADSGCTSIMTKNVVVIPPPTVSFEEPFVVCEASASHFIADVASTVVSTSWNFGDPASGTKNTSEALNPYHRYDISGTYTITLSVEDIYGCSNSFSREVIIAPNGLIGNIDILGTSPLCEGDTIVLVAPPNGISWIWSNGEVMDSITVNEEDVYSVTVTDSNGCMYVPALISIEVIPSPSSPIRVVEYDDFGQPNAYFYNTYQICQGEEVFLEILENANYGYQWSNGTSSSEIEYSDDRDNLLDAGNYDFFVTVTDNATSCQNVEGPFEVIVNPLPISVQITASNTGLICENTSTTFSVVNPDVNLTYIWSNGNTGTTMTTAKAGIYTALARTEFSCEGEKSNAITITAGPDISKIPTGCHTRCSPDEICIPPIAGVASYQWYFNGNPVAAPEGTIIDFVITESGEYYVEMVSNQGCTLASPPLTLDVYDGFGMIEGNVYADANENGIIDVSDTLVSGVDIQLLLNGFVTDIDPSDTFGFYAFENILSTDYTLELDESTIPSNLEATIISIDTALVGCDDNVIYSWLLVEKICPENITAVSFEGCIGDQFSYNNMSFENDTTFTTIYASANGCDSVETITVLLHPELSTMLEMPTCTGTTVAYNGVDYNPGDVVNLVFTSQTNCDSIVNLVVTEILTSSNTINFEGCTGDQFMYNNTSLGNDTTFTALYLNANGCDSMETVTVLLHPEITEMVEMTACTGMTVTYNDVDYSPGDETSFMFTGQSGCDSVVNLIVTEIFTSTNTINFEGCTSDGFTYNDMNFDNDTTFTALYLNANGCDSMETVTVLLHPEITEMVEMTACTGTTVTYNDVDYSPGDETSFMFTGQSGCDSVVNLVVTEILTSSNIINFEGCTSDGFTYNDMNFDTDTTFTALYLNANGCDSMETVTVLLHPEITEMVEMATCTGTTVTYNGVDYNPGDEANFIFTGQFGCDSVVNLMVNEVFASTNAIQLQACLDETVAYNGIAIKTGESMDFMYINAAGCDSLVNVSVNSFPEVQGEIETDESCPNLSTGIAFISATAGTAPYEYALDGYNYQTTSAFLGLPAGNYTSFIRDNNDCVFEMDFNLFAQDNLIIDADDQTLPCATLETTLNVDILSGNDGNLHYLWDNGSTISDRTVNESGIYSLQVANSCEVLQQQINVTLEIDPKKTGMYLPNAFSPNGDGYNDIFKMYPHPDMEFEAYKLSVFDRWGDMVYATKDVSMGWNGIFGNKKMNPAVFVWQLDAIVIVCGKRQKVYKYGEVVLVR